MMYIRTLWHLSAAALRSSRPRTGLIRDRRGVVAMIFGLSALPIMGLVALAIDFGYATQARTQLALAADTGAMQAVTAAANAFTAGNITTTAAAALGVTVGQKWFTVQSGALINASLMAPASVTVTPVLGSDGTTFTGVFNASLTYKVSVATYFAGIIGQSSIVESGQSTATISVNKYVNVTFLLDNSSSMTIASTQAGINALNPLTNAFKGVLPSTAPPLQPCAFACHWDPAASASNPTDFYGIARKFGIQLRFDVLQSATLTSIATMQQQAVIANQFGIGVFTFNCTLNEIYPVSITPLCGTQLISASQISSTNLAGAVPAVQAMNTPVTIDAANTNFTGSSGTMAQLTNLLPTGGDGSTAAKAQQALIIVTDGLEDFNSRSIPTDEGPITAANCAAAKAKGISIYVIYTTYNADPSVLLYGNIALAPYLAGTASPGMVASLTACASSPANFIQATDPAGITAAFNTLLQAALQTPGRFTK